MSVPLTVNGVTYDFPTVDDTDWGYSVTAWAEAITANIFPKTGGNFFLSADLNFGPAASIVANGFSTFVTPSTTGAIRLGYTDTINWRNQANTANFSLAVQDFGSADASLLTFNGKQMVDTTTAQNLYNKTLVNPVISGTISVAIGPNAAAVSDGSGSIVASSTSNTQISYLNTLTSNVQTQLNGKQPLNADLTAIGSLPADGFLVRTGTNTWASRSFTSSDATLTVTNPAGAGGNVDIKVNSVPFSKLTGLPGSLSGYGITDGVANGGNTPSIASGTSGLRPTAGVVGRLFIDSSTNTLQRDNGTDWDVVGSAYVVGSPGIPNVKPIALADGGLSIGDNSFNQAQDSLAIGKQAVVTTNSTRGVALGYQAVAAHRDGVSIGGFATTTEHVGQIAFGNASDRSGTSTAGATITTLVQKTTSATVTEMDVDMLTHDRLLCKDNFTYLYDVDIVARDTTNLAAKNYASWNLKFTFIRGVGAASVILSGVQKTIVGASGAAGWNVTVTADTTGGRPAIKVTGAASTNISWAGFVKTSRVSNV